MTSTSNSCSVSAQTEKLSLSVIILYKKENPALKKAKKSVDFAQEIILIQKEKIIDFSQVRNQALQKVNTPWVLFLDSDEVFAQESIPELKELLLAKNYPQRNYTGASVVRQDIFHQKTLKHGEAGATRLLRLGKKSVLTWKRPVHEVALLKTGEIRKSKIKIFHYSHQNISSFLQKIIIYSNQESTYRMNNLKQENRPITVPIIFPIIIKLQLLIYPFAKFIYAYFFKLGFLDGYRGLVYAFIMSLHSLSVRSMILEKLKKKKSKINYD